MFLEVPYDKDPVGQPEVHSFSDILLAFDGLMHRAPAWTDAAEKAGLVGCPFNAVINWPMGTSSGTTFFLLPRINVHLKEILNRWADFLLTPDSVQVLAPPNGWLGTRGIAALTTKGNENGFLPANTFGFT